MISCTETPGATTHAPSNYPFTPGPWEVSPMSSTLVTTAEDADGNVRNVAQSYFYDRRVPGSKEQSEANARLIAAAPEFYEFAVSSPCECDYDHSCRRCRVLAKARGAS